MFERFQRISERRTLENDYHQDERPGRRKAGTNGRKIRITRAACDTDLKTAVERLSEKLVRQSEKQEIENDPYCYSALKYWLEIRTSKERGE